MLVLLPYPDDSGHRIRTRSDMQILAVIGVGEQMGYYQNKAIKLKCVKLKLENSPEF